MTVNDLNPILSTIESVGETLNTLSSEVGCDARARKRLSMRLKTEIGLLQDVLADLVALESEP